MTRPVWADALVVQLWWGSSDGFYEQAAEGVYVLGAPDSVEDFQSGELVGPVVVGGDSMGEVLGGHGGLAEDNAEGVGFRVVRNSASGISNEL